MNCFPNQLPDFRSGHVPRSFMNLIDERKNTISGAFFSKFGHSQDKNEAPPGKVLIECGFRRVQLSEPPQEGVAEGK